MQPISNNGFSLDQQIDDAVTYLRLNLMPEWRAFQDAFPEYSGLEWWGAWVDPEASDVDNEYMSWVADWIEANTRITWEDGEPFLVTDDDRIEDGADNA